MNEVEEIKNRLNIADIVSEYIELTAAGTNFKARCPFHNEKTPSFFVSPEKQIWHCFGACQEGGDIFSFVQKMEGIEFRDALKILADKAGVRLTPRQPQEESRRNRLLEICDWAARFFHRALFISREGKIARDYLILRKVGEKAIRAWELGYAPRSWDLTSRFLKKKGYNEEEILAAGLATRGKSGKCYDRFRGRLAFPIRNIHDQVVGFGARVLDPQNDPLGKYINSPQTLIYDKSHILYGLDRAKQEIKQKNLCIAVEGYLDVISSYEAGIRNVIAVSGTALTQGQLSLIKRYTRKLALCFDADSAGREAAKRGISNAVASGLSVELVVLPTGEDPDSLIKKNPLLWPRLISKRQPVMDFYFTTVFQKYNPQTLEGKKLVAREILPLLKNIPDPIEQAYYLQKLAMGLDVEEEVLREAMGRMRGEQRFITSSPKPTPKVVLNLPPAEILGRRILGLGLKYPEFLGEILAKTPFSLFSSPLKVIYKELKKYYNKDRGFNFADFKRKIQSSYPHYVTKLDVAVLDVEKDFREEEESRVTASEVESVLKRLRKEYLQQKLKAIGLEIKKAESKGEKKTLEDLAQRFFTFTQELGKL